MSYPKFNSFTPSSIFLVILVLVLVFPSFLIWVFDYQEQLRTSVSTVDYSRAINENFAHTLISFVCIVLVRYYSFFYDFKLKKLIYKQDSSLLFIKPRANGTSDIKIMYLLGYLSVLFVVIYVYSAGFNKLMALGSDKHLSDFRLYNSFDDVNRFAKALLQGARRLFFPFVLIYLTVLSYFYRVRLFERLLFSILFVISVLMTLDRGPLLMMLVMMIYLKLLRADRPIFYIMKYMPFLIGLVVLAGGLMSYIQHNLLNVSAGEVISSGFYFVWHRIGAAPSIAAIELSFLQFPATGDFLHLKYSRLMALIGGEYTGTNSVTSIYVAPVGYVGDLWRNFGSFGVISGSLFIGGYLRYLDKGVGKLDYPLKAAVCFSTITLTFYLTHGVLFSQGVLLQMSFLIAVLGFFKKANHNTKLSPPSRTSPHAFSKIVSNSK